MSELHPTFKKIVNVFSSEPSAAEQKDFFDWMELQQAQREYREALAKWRESVMETLKEQEKINQQILTALEDLKTLVANQ